MIKATDVILLMTIKTSAFLLEFLMLYEFYIRIPLLSKRKIFHSRFYFNYLTARIGGSIYTKKMFDKHFSNIDMQCLCVRIYEFRFRNQLEQFEFDLCLFLYFCCLNRTIILLNKSKYFNYFCASVGKFF